MKKRICLRLLTFVGALVFGLSAFGQRTAPGGISGVVSESGADGQAKGIPYAVVSIPSIGVNVVTDIDGNYIIKNLQPSEYEITIQSLGYETVTEKVSVSKSVVAKNFAMKVADFRLEDVVVTATVSKAGAATASNISRTAIEHMQATSLNDVMTLLPGADIADDSFKPDLQGIKTISIRGAGANSTAIVMDGAPISNNANMQIMTSSTGSSLPGGEGMSPSSGIDLRTITTGNIESVEVIRGIAPVEYGDAGGGTVIVNSKVGLEPMTVTFNTNPNVYSIALTQGLKLGEKKGFLNYGGDYAYSVADPREAYDIFQRATGRLSYSNTFGRLHTTTTASFTWTKSKAEPNPDDEDDFQTSNSRSYGIRLGTNGTYNVDLGWFKNVKYNVTFNYTDRLSYFSDNLTAADVAYSFSKQDGSVLSSIAGQRIYDDSGAEITNFGSDLAGEKSWITPAAYQTEYNVYGKELNTYAKLLATFAGKIGGTSHKIIVGADFNSDGNRGDGKVFDPETPPYRNVSYTYATQRERAYKDIPFLNRFGVYASEDFRADIFNRELMVVAGVRYDKVSGINNGAIAPRVNASYELIPGVLSVRGGYGINVKTPGLAYVYPDNAYFDMINFNNSLSTTVPDAQKFQVITTHVYDASNADLELAKQTKYEAGFDLNIGKVKMSVTAFKDFSNNGYSFSKLLDNFKLVTYNQYSAASYPTDGTTLPALTLASDDNYLLSYTTPANNSCFERQGVDFVIDFGRINAIRTSFMINGEYYESKYWSKSNIYYNTLGTDGSANIGVYDGKITGGVDGERNIITNFIATHNIPNLGLVISMTANVNWRYTSWTEYGADDDIPVQYISIDDGKVYDFDKSWVADETSATYAQWLSILRNEANGAISSKRREHEPAYHPALCINTNVTKQFDKFSVSVFANNMFRSTPLQKSVVYPGTYYRRNASTFFFGLQLTAKLF